MNAFKKWLRARRDRQHREIANAVHDRLSARQSWERFLPPVVVRDTVYMVTENGSIYAMRPDYEGMEQIIQIRRN